MSTSRINLDLYVEALSSHALLVSAFSPMDERERGQTAIHTNNRFFKPFKVYSLQSHQGPAASLAEVSRRMEAVSSSFPLQPGPSVSRSENARLLVRVNATVKVNLALDDDGSNTDEVELNSYCKHHWSTLVLLVMLICYCHVLRPESCLI